MNCGAGCNYQLTAKYSIAINPAIKYYKFCILELLPKGRGGATGKPPHGISAKEAVHRFAIIYFPE